MSLFLVLSKVLETIVVFTLTQNIDRHHLLNTRQFGISQGKSVADLHLQLLTEWSAALERGNAALVVVLNIERAFDRECGMLHSS